MIYAASTIAGPVAFGCVCIHILCLCLPFMFYLMEGVRKLVTWQKLAFKWAKELQVSWFLGWRCVRSIPQGLFHCFSRAFWILFLPPCSSRKGGEPAALLLAACLLQMMFGEGKKSQNPIGTWSPCAVQEMLAFLGWAPLCPHQIWIYVVPHVACLTFQTDPGQHKFVSGSDKFQSLHCFTADVKSNLELDPHCQCCCGATQGELHISSRIFATVLLSPHPHEIFVNVAYFETQWKAFATPEDR